MSLPVRKEIVPGVQTFQLEDFITEDRLVLIDFLGDLKGKKIVDIGCGSGFLTRELAKRTGKVGAVLGVDINPGKIKEAVKNPEKFSNLMYAIGMSNSIPAGFFDAAVLSRVINSISIREVLVSTFDEITKILVPEGTLVVSGPDLQKLTPVASNEGVLLVEQKSELKPGDRVDTAARTSEGGLRKISHYFWPPETLEEIALSVGLVLSEHRKVKASAREKQLHPTHLQHAQYFDVLSFKKPGSG